MKRNLLLTRPKPQSEAFLAALSLKAQETAVATISPLIEIRGIHPAPAIPAFDIAIFTSANGVRFAPDGENRPTYCVGSRTAKAAERWGWRVVDHTLDAETLLDRLMKNEAAATFLHFAGRHRRVEIAELLAAQGRQAGTLVIYEQDLKPLSESAQALFRANKPVLVPLFSPRTAAQFMHQVKDPASAFVIAMSQAVAAPVNPDRVAGLQIAAAPTAEEMRRSIENLLSQTSLS